MTIKDKLVRVEWVDSSTASSWTLMEDFKDEQHDPIKIVSYGIIVKETDDYLIIAQNYGTNPPQICNTTAIPKGCIIKQKIIKSEDKMEAVVDKNTYTIKNTPNCGISVYNEEHKESEDEKIRKEIIKLVKFYYGSSLALKHTVSKDEMVAWLEKQSVEKEINPTLQEKERMDDAFTKMMLKPQIVREEKPKWSEEDIREAQLDYWRSVGGKEWHGVPVQETIAWLERQSEQVVILHKFKVGDWIVSKWGGIYQIKEVMSGSYNLLCTNNAEEINSITQVDNNSRLLCIGDIKNLESQGKQKWSDEDENFFANICTIIDADRNFTESAKRKCKDWLKSLKKRMEEL